MNKLIIANLADGIPVTIFLREIVIYHTHDVHTMTMVHLQNGKHLIVDAPKKDFDDAVMKLLGNDSVAAQAVSLLPPVQVANIPHVPYNEQSEDDIMDEIRRAM